MNGESKHKPYDGELSDDVVLGSATKASWAGAPSLDLETLEVSSFPTEPAWEERGTVDGFAISGIALTCRSCPTRVNTCCTP